MSKNQGNFNRREVRIPCGDVTLDGDLVVPTDADGLVIFAHGSGSSRSSPRNRMVAEEINKQGLATLLFDLLTPEEGVEESTTGALRFNIPFLTERLIKVTGWVEADEKLAPLGIGYFGASTGAAAALVAASRVAGIQAVVSRGGRTDLAGDAVNDVHAPTLLIVGELDEPVVEWNEETFERLPGQKRLSPVAGATHLFQEPGTLETVAELAASWFKLYLMRKGT